jgi:hypothetical protein
MASRCFSPPSHYCQLTGPVRMCLIRPTRYHHASLTYHRLVPGREGCNSIMNLGSFCYREHFIFSSINSSISDIVFNSIVEQRSILRNNPNSFSQRLQRHIPDVLAVYEDSSGLNIIKTEKQSKNSGFTVCPLAMTSAALDTISKLTRIHWDQQ